MQISNWGWGWGRLYFWVVEEGRGRPGGVGLVLNTCNIWGQKSCLGLFFWEWGGTGRVGIDGLCWDFVGVGDLGYGAAFKPLFLRFSYFNPPKILQIS